MLTPVSSSVIDAPVCPRSALLLLVLLLKLLGQTSRRDEEKVSGKNRVSDTSSGKRDLLLFFYLIPACPSFFPRAHPVRIGLFATSFIPFVSVSLVFLKTLKCR